MGWKQDSCLLDGFTGWFQGSFYVYSSTLESIARRKLEFCKPGSAWQAPGSAFLSIWLVRPHLERPRVTHKHKHMHDSTKVEIIKIISIKTLLAPGSSLMRCKHNCLNCTLIAAQHSFNYYWGQQTVLNCNWEKHTTILTTIESTTFEGSKLF